MEITVEQYENLVAENENLRAQLRLMTDKVQYLLKQMFGPKSEKLNPDQLLLLFGNQATVEAKVEAEAEVVEVVCTSRKQAKRKTLAERLPDNLPIEEVVIEPAEVLQEPEAYNRIGEEVTVELDVTPAKFFKRHIIRPKYIKVTDKRLPPVVAPAPKRLIENSFASVGLVVAIVLSKYVDHLPLYRQEQIFKSRHGVDLSRKTMCGWVWQIAHQLALIYEALRDEIKASGYMQVDETPVDYQDPGSGSCGQGYLWASRASGLGVLFEWFSSRASECLKKMLAGFKGQLQSDGYAAYEAFYNKAENQLLRAEVELAGCWAHARRKFFDAREESVLAAGILKHIQELYRVEAELREAKAEDEVRLSTRKAKSLPILVKIKEELGQAQSQHLPQSLTGKAIHYTLEQWEKLLVYTRHGRMEIDNNLVENAIRPTAVGKKNWLFFGSEEAGQSSAILYSLLESCRMLGLNPQDYLSDILARLPTMTNQMAANFTPSKWKAARAKAPSA